MLTKNYNFGRYLYNGITRNYKTKRFFLCEGEEKSNENLVEFDEYRYPDYINTPVCSS